MAKLTSMHVLIAVLHRPIKPTGVCRHAVNLALCLADKLEVTKITLVMGAWQQDYFNKAFTLDSDKIETIAVEIKNSSVSRNLWFLWGLPKLVNVCNPDIVHLSFPFPIFETKFKVPIVSTIHDLYPYEYPENFGFPQVWFNRLFLKQCIQDSDGLTCVSQVTRNKLKFYFPNLEGDRKIEVIYNYVDFKNIQPQTPKQFPQDNPFLLSVAQHRQNKNLDLLIKAYALLLNEQKLTSNTKLVIVGASGPETENIGRLIDSLNLEDKVILLSAIADAELCWLYQHCQVFIMPSSTEGFCLPLVEALQFGERIVCSDIPIFKEVVANNCLYFSLGDNPVSNLCQAIIKSLNMNSTVCDNHAIIFSKQSVSQKYFTFYQSQIKQL